MLNDKQDKSFKDFAALMSGDQALDEKTGFLIRLAAAMAVGCYPWMEHLLGVAGEQGVSQEEIAAVLGNVMLVAAGSTMQKAMEIQNKVMNQA